MSPFATGLPPLVSSSCPCRHPDLHNRPLHAALWHAVHAVEDTVAHSRYGRSRPCVCCLSVCCAHLLTTPQHLWRLLFHLLRPSLDPPWHFSRRTQDDLYQRPSVLTECTAHISSTTPRPTGSSTACAPSARPPHAHIAPRMCVVPILCVRQRGTWPRARVTCTDDA